MRQEERLASYKTGKKVSKLINFEFYKKFDGVTFIDPESVYIWSPGGINDLWISKDSVIGPNVYFFGKVSIGFATMIQPGTRITRSSIGSYCDIGGNIIDSILHNSITTGPHTELTRCTIDEHTIAKHYCYLGDAIIGKHVNIAAGTITGNFDGTPEKNKVVIGDYAKTGINCNLVSTKKNNKGILYIGEHSTIGAGAVIKKDVPPGATVVGLDRIIKIEEKKR